LRAGGKIHNTTMTLQNQPETNIDHLKALVKSGKLFDVQAYIASGKPVWIPQGKKRTALELAARSGFHSMVEVLLGAWPDRDSIDDALRGAI